MSAKVVLIALFLVAASAVHDTRTNIQDFTRGFLQGVATAPIFDNIKTCLADSTDFVTQVGTAIRLIETKDPAKVKQGIVLLGQAVQIIPEAARACQASEADIAKLIILAKSFSSPTAFAYHVGKSLLVNRVEVLHEVNSAIAAYNNQDFLTLGYWVGRAMDTIFLGMNRTLRPEFNQFLNTIQSSFVAGEVPEKFRGMTLAQIKAQFLGAIPDDEESINVFDYEGASNDIPKEFDAAKEWPGCIHPIRDQGHCGSCWAFAASEVLSDRFCIASNHSVNVVLSPQYLVSCDSGDYGCNGGYPVVAWRFIINNGLVTDACWPYASYNGTVPKCSTFTQCADGSAIRKLALDSSTLASLLNDESKKAKKVLMEVEESPMIMYKVNENNVLDVNYGKTVQKIASGKKLGKKIRNNTKVLLDESDFVWFIDPEFEEGSNQMNLNASVHSSNAFTIADCIVATKPEKSRSQQYSNTDFEVIDMPSENDETLASLGRAFEQTL